MILVTGASGLLGASLVVAAREQNHEVVGLYNRHPVSIDGVKLLAADLTDPAEFRRIFDEVEPSWVVHCAAATDVDWCETHPEEAYRINVMVSSAIAEVTSRSNSRLLYISTDSVFNGERGNYAETDQPVPVNVYAKTKLQGEREILRRDPAAAIARVNLYGWNVQKKDSLAEWVLKELSARQLVRGFSDVVFCPAVANDVADILLALLHRNLSGIYHVVGSEPVSKYVFAKRVAAAFGFDPARVSATLLADAKLKAQRPLDVSLNTGKICAALGRSMPDVDAGLRRFVQLRENGYADRIKSHLAGVQE
ncbi:MAG: SDR family oxidoreductase [Candidatus Sulfotelmatobacter sp.]